MLATYFTITSAKNICVCNPKTSAPKLLMLRKSALQFMNIRDTLVNGRDKVVNVCILQSTVTCTNLLLMGYHGTSILVVNAT